MMSAFFVNLLMLFIAGAGSLVIGGIVLNNPPLYEPPGFGERLRTYLTSHVAETQRDHRFPELELRCYSLAPGTLFARVEHAVMALGWETIEMDSSRHYLHAVISTPLLKFKDDLEVHLVPAACGTELHIRSASRIGKGDLGANTRHVLDLFAVLARQA